MNIKTIINQDLQLIQKRIRYYENQIRISLGESIAYERLLAKEEALKELLAKCNKLEETPEPAKTKTALTDGDDFPF